MLTKATLPASFGAIDRPRVALVGSPMMNPEYMSVISGRSRRSSGSPPDRNTRCTPARLPRMVSSWPRVGSPMWSVSEQNTQSKSHLLVTCKITDSGAVAASASAAASVSPLSAK